MFRVGDRIGVYEIVAELRAGGMATLFLGQRAGAAGFAKLVAIKVVHEHLAEDPVFVQMFVDEALLSARIQHPNVVHVEELREHDGHHFLVMEFVHGCSLAQLTAVLVKRNRRLSPELAIHIAIKIADGLHAAHETRDRNGELLGVVHRDISPQNILLSYQGNVKLIDFGIAKAKGRVQGTQGGSIKGKFRYMSPEHAYGKDLDRRADLYSLAIVLFEMLTMRRRFDAASHLDILEVVRHPDVVPPSRYAAGLPTGLDDVVLKAMAKAPEDRFPTGRALRAALVDVNPRAAALHESALGSLLAVVMADQIQLDREQLPSNISGVTLDLPSASPDDIGALETMTLSADVAGVGPSDSGSMDSMGTHRALTAILPAKDGEAEEATVFDPDYVEQMQEHSGDVSLPALEPLEAELDAEPTVLGPPTDPAPPPSNNDPPLAPVLVPQRSQPTLKLDLAEPSEQPSGLSPTRLAAAALGLLIIVTSISFVAVYFVVAGSSDETLAADMTSTQLSDPAQLGLPDTAAMPPVEPVFDAGPAEPERSDAGTDAARPAAATEAASSTRRGRSRPGRSRSGRGRRSRTRSSGTRSSGSRRTGRGRPVASEW